MNTNLKSKDAFDLLQIANKLENSITHDNESLNQKWYSLVQLHGGVQACVELLRPRKLYINELISFMEQSGQCLVRFRKIVKNIS